MHNMHAALAGGYKNFARFLVDRVCLRSIVSTSAWPSFMRAKPRKVDFHSGLEGLTNIEIP
jgi:hypothetical protein